LLPVKTRRELLAKSWSAVTRLALVGGSEAWASHRTPTCPALSGILYLGNKDAARRNVQSSIVLERTEVVRVKNYTKTVAKSDSTVRTRY